MGQSTPGCHRIISWPRLVLAWVWRYMCGHGSAHAATLKAYEWISNIRRTNSQNWNASRFLLQLSLPNPLKHIYIYKFNNHYCGVIMSAMASQITSVSSVYSAAGSGADQRKHQSSVSLAFVWGIHRWPVNSSHKGPVTRKMFPFDDVIMALRLFYYRYYFETRVSFIFCSWSLNLHFLLWT